MVSVKNILPFFTEKVYDFFLSTKRKKQFEKTIFTVAIIAFVIHFLVILLVKVGLIPEYYYSDLGAVPNPIIAIYTPFSIILLYEIYLLIYYLPKSITIYLGKQYEIIALILIRKVFYDLATINLSDYSEIKELLITFLGLIILCLLIFCFYKLNGNKQSRGDEKICIKQENKRFVLEKKILALILITIFIVLFFVSSFEIRYIDSFQINDIVYFFKITNESFFVSFFTVLILTEVLLLLFTFKLSDRFCKIMRNSGFIISTILMKLSFTVEGIENIIVVLAAALFGVIILWIYKLFEQKINIVD